MKWQGYVPTVTNVMIAVSATLAGIVIALGFAPGILAHENWSNSAGVSSLSTLQLESSP